MYVHAGTQERLKQIVGDICEIVLFFLSLVLLTFEL